VSIDCHFMLLILIRVQVHPSAAALECVVASRDDSVGRSEYGQ